MSGGTPYIGSTISLISKAEIRYEGILWSIDTKDSTVTLANVRSYGTEDRAAEKQVGPRSEVYEYIVFRGSDIKDLHVSKAPLKPRNTVNQDPSILQQGAVGSSFTHFPNAAPYAAGYGNFAHPYGYGSQPATYSPVPQPGINPGRAGSPVGIPLIQSRTPSPPVNVPLIGSVAQTRTLESETQTPQPPSQKSTQTGRPRRRSGSRRNSLEVNQNGPNKPGEKKPENEEAPKNQKPNENKTKAPGGGQRSGSQSGNTKKGKSIKFNGEFDFESSNARFDKEKIESELKSEIERMKISSQDEEVIVENEVELESPAADSVYYDKSKSFFDNISSDPLPSEPGRRMGSWQEERKLNVETFGVSGSYTRGYGRGRGWRGRGWGRGRGRGRGRGGYRGNNDGDGGNRGDGDRNQQNRRNYRGGRGGFRGNRGNRGTWKNNRNTSPSGERIKTEQNEMSS